MISSRISRSIEAATSIDRSRGPSAPSSFWCPSGLSAFLYIFPLHPLHLTSLSLSQTISRKPIHIFTERSSIYQTTPHKQLHEPSSLPRFRPHRHPRPNRTPHHQSPIQPPRIRHHGRTNGHRSPQPTHPRHRRSSPGRTTSHPRLPPHLSPFHRPRIYDLGPYA